MKTIKIGSFNEKKGITISPKNVLFNNLIVEKIMYGAIEIWNRVPKIFFVNGASYKPITAYAAGMASQSKVAPTIRVIDNTYLNIMSNPGQEGSVWFNEGIDLTNYKTLTVHFYYGNYGGVGQIAFFLRKDKNIVDGTYFYRGNGSSETLTKVLDISSYTGTYYFGVWTYYYGGVDFYKIEFS